MFGRSIDILFVLIRILTFPTFGMHACGDADDRSWFVRLSRKLL